MGFLGYTAFTYQILVLLYSPGKCSNDNKDKFRQEEKEEGTVRGHSNLTLTEHDALRHNLSVMPSTYIWGTP